MLWRLAGPGESARGRGPSACSAAPPLFVRCQTVTEVDYHRERDRDPALDIRDGIHPPGRHEHQVVFQDQKLQRVVGGSAGKAPGDLLSDASEGPPGPYFPSRSNRILI